MFIYNKNQGYLKSLEKVLAFIRYGLPGISKASYKNRGSLKTSWLEPVNLKIVDVD